MRREREDERRKRYGIRGGEERGWGGDRKRQLEEKGSRIEKSESRKTEREERWKKESKTGGKGKGYKQRGWWEKL